MSTSKLPERASLEYLKKLAKERLKQLRHADPHTQLAAAQLAVARDHGFSSWRTLKAEIEQRQTKPPISFFEACAQGDIAVLRALLANDPGLARASNPKGQYPGWTGLHIAAKSGQLEVVKLLLRHGAAPNAREAGDNTYPLHWAAAHRHLEVVQALLDAGGDVHGIGDVHELDAIGWATFYHDPAREPGHNPEVAALLVERGARHHIFSAISLGDMELIRNVVEQNPKAFERRTSRFEGKQTALHFAASLKRYDILDLLIELGADLEAEDQNGNNALASAMMRGDQEAIKRLHAAGAKGNKGWTLLPARTKRSVPPRTKPDMDKMANRVSKIVPMIRVPDIARTLEWYTSIGFKELGRYADENQVNWGMLQFGKAQIMLNIGGKPGPHDVTLWFYTAQVDDLYQTFKSRQIEAAQAALAGNPGGHEAIEFVADIDNPPYGGREFGIRDLNGYILYFRSDG
jgi:ankyrin repeat protein